MRASTFQGGQCRGFFCFASHMSLVLETVRRHSILTSLKRRWLSMESRIRFTVKEWRQEICGKTSSEDLGRKTARWMQETFLPETDSLYSWISGIWETMIFMEVDWDWWIRKNEFSSQLTGKRQPLGMLNVTSSSSQMLSSSLSTESLKSVTY